MTQEDRTALVATLIIACAVIVLLLWIIRKWERIAKKTIRNLGKPLILNESFVGRHFFVHGFYPRKQLSPTYEAFWMIEARVEGKEGMLVLKITDKQAGTLIDHPNKLFELRKNGENFSFHLVLEENELFLKLRHKDE
jgi:hypothetical protein